MEPFSLTCTTCKTRLKVRDPSAIGQVLACPKCRGMILVKPPGEAGAAIREEEVTVSDSQLLRSQRDFQPPGDSGNLGRAFDDIDAVLSGGEPPPPPMPSPNRSAKTVAAVPVDKKSPAGKAGGGSGSKSTFAPLPPGTAPAPVKPSATPAAPSPPLAAAKPAIGSPEAPLPRSEWAGKSPRKYLFILAGSVLAGVVLAVTAVMLVVRFIRPAGTLDPSNTPVAQVVAGQDKLPEKTSPVKPDPTKAVEVPEADPQQPKAVDPAIPDPANPTETPADPADKPKPEMPAAEGDPLGIATIPNNPAKEPQPPANPADDPLKRFKSLLGWANDEDESTMPKEKPKPAAPAVSGDGSETPPLEEPAAQPTLPRPAPRTIDVAARLADSIPGIELENVPLIDFLQTMSDLSTIPITLVPDALPLVRVSPTTPVQTKLAKTTFQQALVKTLETIGLELVQVENQLLVLPPETKGENLWETAYPVTDLTEKDDRQAAELLDWVTSLVAPGTWSETDDGKTPFVTQSPDQFRIRQLRSHQSQLLMLFEKLRVARGKPLKSTKYDPAIFQLTSRTQSAAPKLDQPITLNFQQPTSLLKIVYRLQSVAKVRILIDWQSLAPTGWTPDGEATLLTEKVPLRQALVTLLEPMELTYRVLDNQTLQIVSRPKLAEHLELEFYRVETLAANEDQGVALIERLRESLGPTALRADGGKGELRFDPVSKCLLASLPQPDQQRLEGLITKWQEKPAAETEK